MGTVPTETEPSSAPGAVHHVRVAGCSLFGPFKSETGSGLAPADALEFDDDRLRRIDRVTRLCLRGAESALANAGLPRGDPARNRCGIFLGNAYGAYEANLDHQRIILEQGGRACSPAVFTNTLANVAAGWISIVEGLKGPMMTFASGLLASAEALIRAVDELRAGGKGHLLAGGAYAFHEDVHAVLERARGGHGFQWGESAAFLVLSRADGISGEILLKGCGLARASGVPDPLERALQMAGCHPDAALAVLVAGDASKDGETLIRLEASGYSHGYALSATHGDLAESAPAAGAVLAVRWLQGSWAPPEAPAEVHALLVAGLDPCARRAFAMRFAKAP